MIQDKIQAAIREHLPQALGQELRQVLEQAEKDREALRRATEALADKRTAYDELFARSLSLEQKLQEQSSWAKDLDQREKAVEKDMLRLHTTLLTVQLQEANKRAEVVTDLVRTLFRAPAFKERVVGTVPLPVEGSPGNPQYGMSPTGGTILTGHTDVVTERTTD